MYLCEMTRGKQHIHNYMVLQCSELLYYSFQWISATRLAELIQFWQDPKCRRNRTCWRRNINMFVNSITRYHQMTTILYCRKCFVCKCVSVRVCEYVYMYMCIYVHIVIKTGNKISTSTSSKQLCMTWCDITINKTKQKQTNENCSQWWAVEPKQFCDP